MPSRLPLHLAVLLTALYLAAPVAAEDVYLAPDAFLDSVFSGSPPRAETIWLTGARREAAARILNRRPAALRVRYWRDGPRTAWILEEIGKTLPITAGFVVEEGPEGGELARLDVLIYRESHGWEVRHDFFTEQFERARLTEKLALTRAVDGISGATLSVSAMKAMAQLALYLHGEVMTEAGERTR